MVNVAVRVKPGAGRDRVGGRHEGPYGPALIIAVRAPAVDGRATEAARLRLAEAIGVRRADVALRTGATGRNKLFTVAAPESQVQRVLEALRDRPEPGGAAAMR